MNMFEKQIFLNRLKNIVRAIRETETTEINFNVAKRFINEQNLVPKTVNDNRMAAIMVQLANGNTGWLETLC